LKNKAIGLAVFLRVFRIANHPIYKHPLPVGHRFPMEKYELLPEQLIYEGIVATQQFFEPDVLSDEVVLLAHDSSYLTRLKNGELSGKEQRKIGFPWSEALVERELRIAQGTVDACHFALEFGVSFNIAGGTHHAYRASGEGFCMLNDQAIAAAYLLQNKLANKILIIDLDVHQGNGTAAIFEDERRVFTFSMHGADNYPLHKEKSDWDIPLPAGTEDFDYLNQLSQCIEVFKADLKPDFIFYQAGVDVLATDKLGKLKLSREGCKRRDELVLKYAKEQNIPAVVCMGGGYSARIADIVDAHVNTYRVACDLFC
jgi:acetoin utilization deacetylase AcuC-like enzyme